MKTEPLDTFEDLQAARAAGKEILVTGSDGHPKLRPSQTPPESKQLFKSATGAGWRFKVEAE